MSANLDNEVSNVYTAECRVFVTPTFLSDWQRMDERTAVFIISVAAKLVSLHPSTLRKYESCGLLEPRRPTGRLRLYSIEDVARLHQIKSLVEDQGINVAGVKLALALTEKTLRLRQLVNEDESEPRRGEIRAIADDMLDLLGAGRPRADHSTGSSADDSSRQG